MKKIFDYVGLLIKYKKLKKENEKKDKKIEELNDGIKTLLKNQDFLFNENTTLKQINRKKYVQQEDKMYFLIEREKKLQQIEQMEKNGEDFRKIRKIIKGEENDKY